jgi:hypothetical protein
MARPKLHLDADASRRALQEGLVSRGHDVTRTPMPDLPADASDDLQLLWATVQGRVIFTHNIRDFIHKTGRYPNHCGIVLAHRESYSLAQLIDHLDRLLSVTTAEEWVGQVRWLSDFKGM